MLKKITTAGRWVLLLAVFVFLLMAGATAATPPTTTENADVRDPMPAPQNADIRAPMLAPQNADIRAPMLALIAGALMCVSLMPCQPVGQRAFARAMTAIVGTSSGWFWLVDATGSGAWPTLTALGYVVFLAAVIVIILAGIYLLIVLEIRGWRKRRRPS